MSSKKNFSLIIKDLFFTGLIATVLLIPIVGFRTEISTTDSTGLIFNYRLLKLAFVKFYITSCEQNLIINTNNHIRNSLTPFLDVIYANRTLTCIFRKCEYLANKVMPYLRFLLNSPTTPINKSLS